MLIDARAFYEYDQWEIVSTLRKWTSYGIINRYLFRNFSCLIFKWERFWDITLIGGESLHQSTMQINKFAEWFAFLAHIENSNNLALFPAQDNLEDTDDYERVDNSREVMQLSKKLLKSVLRKKVLRMHIRMRRQSLKKHGIPTSWWRQILFLKKHDEASQINVSKSGYGDKFPGQTLTLDDFVIVMKEVIQGSMSTDELKLIS